MPRIRSIKPEFFVHEGVGALEPLARILFVGLWCMADREGRLVDRPARIKAIILPYDDADADRLLDALVDGGFILRYEASGEKLVQIRSFGDHQRPGHREAASVLPAPGTDFPGKGMDFPGRSRGEGDGFGGGEREGEGKGSALASVEVAPAEAHMREDRPEAMPAPGPEATPYEIGVFLGLRGYHAEAFGAIADAHPCKEALEDAAREFRRAVTTFDACNAARKSHAAWLKVKEWADRDRPLKWFFRSGTWRTAPPRRKAPWETAAPPVGRAPP